MPGPWGPPSMMYPPYSPLPGWYRPWAPSPIPFHMGWSGLAGGFGYGGYYAGDGRYGHVSHQQDNWILRQENRMVRNPKPDGSISQETATAPGCWHEQEALKDGPFADQPESSQGRTRSRSKSSADDKTKPNAKKSPEELAAEQNRVLEAKAEAKTEAGTSS
jgi:hypothetical protein